jgi:hypothetical protein
MEGYIQITKASDLRIGTTVTVIYNKSMVKPFKHVIRERVVLLTKKGPPTQDSETIEQYEDYKDWLRSRS